MPSSAVFAKLEEFHPSITSELSNIMRLAPETTDAKLLQLCSTYVDAALRQQSWVPPARGLTDKERAFISFTEQFTSSVSTMSDEQVKQLLQFASADEVYAFVNALYVVDMVGRLELVAGRVLQ